MQGIPASIGIFCFSHALSWAHGVQAGGHLPRSTRGWVSWRPRDLVGMDDQLDFAAELRERRPARRPAGGREELLVAAEVAALLRVTTAWVYADTRANRLPHLRLGRYVRYRASAIEAWMAEQEQRIAGEPRG